MRRRRDHEKARNDDVHDPGTKHLPDVFQAADFTEKGRIGWGTWIRTKINGVRVRRSTVELFPSRGDTGLAGACEAGL
ncbi:protein of unknown function [Shinella sp. WSC3-e]|nr:hypothetical protein SHINE37_40121 [Rhizobiaceae bacterium]CAK7254810.1 protein of unknown function [Shinella sp. WSC3-e]